MKSPLNFKSFIAVALCLSAMPTSSSALPSGLKTLPSNIRVPDLDGQVLPVDLIPDEDDNRKIWVQPLRGKFIGQGVVKSPLTNCELIQEELKIQDVFTEARQEVAEMLRKAQREYKDNQDKLNEYVRKYEELISQVEPYEKAEADAKSEKSEATHQITTLKAELASLQDLLIVAEPSQIQALQTSIESKEEEIDEAKTAFLGASGRLREAQSQLNLLRIETGEAEGRMNGMRKTLATTFDELGSIQEQFDRLESSTEKVLQKYSERIGGYATFTSEFAPAEFLKALREANKGYQFQYVPNFTGTVDATIPGNIRENSTLNRRIGTLILDAKWSDPSQARKAKPLNSTLFKLDEGSTDPVTEAQSIMAQSESSLTGAKFLSLELSVLGFCALREPESLASQFNGGAADTFKLAFYYTYPMFYDLSIAGWYNSYEMLYDFYKKTSSSSWFGLRKSQKEQHMTEYRNEKYMKVSIKPRGVSLSPQETLDLANKVKDQLIYFSMLQHLKMDASNMQVGQTPDLGSLGAHTVGARLMRIPHPWTYWSGFVLSSLGSLFGGKSSTQIREIKRFGKVDIHYDLGFTFMIGADLTIGDLKNQKVEVRPL